jgi:hypothetical protein
MTNRYGTDQLNRLTCALLAPVRQHKGKDATAAITSAFDVLQIFDRLATGDVELHTNTFMQAAGTIMHFCQDSLPYDQPEVHTALMNNSINLVMLVVEDLERRGHDEEASKHFATAVQYADYFLIHSPEALLTCFSIAGYTGMCKRRVNVGKVRLRMMERHAHNMETRREIGNLLKIAERVLVQAELLRDRAARFFDVDLDWRVLRLRPQTPLALEKAASAILFGRQHIITIQVLPPNEGAIGRARRAFAVSQLVLAHVQSSIALAYVEHFKGAKALDSFGVLAHQAKAYAYLTQGEDWEFFAPIAMIRPEEALTQQSLTRLNLLIQRGNAALAYALCMKAQIELEPTRKQPADVCRETTKIQVAAKPLQWPVSWAANEFDKNLTQDEVVASHLAEKGNYRRWTGPSNASSLTVKRRLVGFEGTRGGQTKRKTR